MSLNAQPNKAHYALSELARRKPKFLTLSQNVDGLSPRAGHPEDQLKLLHGNLFNVKCEDEDGCGYFRRNDFTDPITPALAIPEEEEEETSSTAQSRFPPNQTFRDMIASKAALIKGLDISNAETPLSTIPRDSLPHCPQCKTSLLRPGVVWFGESLPQSALSDIDAYFNESDTNQSQTKPIDLCLVIGTSSKVYPAAGYASVARAQGARVAIVNMDRSDARDLQEGDWFFEGDAAEIVPEILRSVIGEVRLPEDGKVV